MKFRRYTAILSLLLLAVSITFISSCLDQKPLENDPEVEATKTTETTKTEEPAVTPDAVAAPEYKNLVDGKNISLEAMKGQVIMVDFWATWCGPCRKEIPGFIELYDEYKDKGVNIVGISTDDGEAVVKRFIEQQKINYPIIMYTRELVIEYSNAIGQPIRAIPTTIIVNQKGEVAAVHVGAKPKSVFKQEIEKLLAEG